MITCWMCGSEQPIKETDFGDHICNSCGCLISVYDKNSAEKEPTQKDLSTYDEYILNRETEQREENVSDLKSWSKENSKFIKIPSGEIYEGVYQGYREGVNMNGEPAIIYKLDGKELKSSSAKLANLFSAIAEGTKVQISREGEGLQTKWSVKTL